MIHVQRPVRLSGIEEFVRRGDLSDRSVYPNLPPIARRNRRREDKYWSAFHRDEPKTLSGLLDAVVGGLRELPSIKLPELPRMADFVAFDEAVGHSLGWPAGMVLTAYKDNRREATSHSSMTRSWPMSRSEPVEKFRKSTHDTIVKGCGYNEDSEYSAPTRKSISDSNLYR